MGNRAICAPSKAQPPAADPGLGLAQPDFSFLLCSQAGSSSNAAMSFVDFMAFDLIALFVKLKANSVPFIIPLNYNIF
jgi:hypothetical protein